MRIEQWRRKKAISMILETTLAALLLKLFLLILTVAYLNLGTSLIALGRCHEAASVLRDGTKLDGSGLRDRSAHENARISSLLQLGGLYSDQGKLQRALAVYREALHTLPKTYPPQVSIILYNSCVKQKSLNAVIQICDVTKWFWFERFLL